jgi:hypothetical protein
LKTEYRGLEDKVDVLEYVDEDREKQLKKYK